MKIYIDSEFKCHVNQEVGYAIVETNFFDGFCTEYIEGHRFVPSGCTWTRDDGIKFVGEMVAPWKSWNELDELQRTYERSKYTELTVQNEELLSTMAEMVEEVYQSDLEEME